MTNKEKKKAKTIAELAQWIDTLVVAEMIVYSLEDQDKDVTFENGKQLWGDTLELIGGGIKVLV